MTDKKRQTTETDNRERQHGETGSLYKRIQTIGADNRDRQQKQTI